MEWDSTGQVIYLGLLLAALGGWAIAEFRGRMGQGLRSLLAWGLIVVALMAGYGLWQDIRPGFENRQMVGEAGQIEIPRDPDGHYYATVLVNGVPIRFLADTGASKMVLTQADAERAGLNPAALAFTDEAMTANGTVMTAPVRLQRVEFGPHLAENVRASVNGGEMDVSLLGMDYLGRFRIEIAEGTMILSR